MANPSENFYYLPVRGRVTIGGETFALMSFSVTYMLDEIPVATFELPIGRGLSGPKEGAVADAEGFLSELTCYTKVEAFLTIQMPGGHAAPPGISPGFPTDKEFCIFTGRASLPSMRKAFNSSDATLTVGAFGEIGILAGVSQYVRGTAQPCAFGTAPALHTLSNNTPGIELYSGFRVNIKDVITEGFWPGIKLILEAIAEKESAFLTLSGNQGFVLPTLDRINVGQALPKATIDLNEVLLTLPGPAQEILKRNVAMTIAKAFAAFSGKIASAENIWEILQDLATTFLFNYIPAVQEDAFAALVPTLIAEESELVTIKPSEYFTFSPTRRMAATDYAEVTNVGMVVETDQSSPFQGPTSPTMIVGSASTPPLPNGERGRLLVRPMPAWLVPSGANSSESLNKGGKIPDLGNLGFQVVKADQGEAEKAIMNSQLGDSVAATYLRAALFGTRQLSLSGRFRMDISPGSQVKVITMGERFTKKQDTLYGMTRGIRLVGGVGKNGGSMATELLIGWVRSAAEQRTFGTDTHPLYSKSGVWAGGKLLAF